LKHRDLSSILQKPGLHHEPVGVCRSAHTVFFFAVTALIAVYAAIARVFLGEFFLIEVDFYAFN
jgi:hypothetical protein